LFLDLDKKAPNAPAVVDNLGFSLTYGDLVGFADGFCEKAGGRTLIFILCENCAGALAGYAACLSGRIVPLMLGNGMDRRLLKALIAEYRPAFLWVPESAAGDFGYPCVLEGFGYALIKTRLEPGPLYDGLSLLLTTSGSTGSPKLVRHSYENVESIARSVAEVFGMDENERGMVSLPLQFTQGLNVASSHLYGGSVALLSTDALMKREFWAFFKAQQATSFTGVPYSYEVLDRLRFFRMDLPHLRTINQGGGRLTDALFMKCAKYAADTGRRFVATYGATETTSRMAYLPPELAPEKCGSIGVAMPCGSISLFDDGREIRDANKTGEIVYKGPNVTLGYAERSADLARGDERGGVYATGDLAWRDEDGCHYIVGRKKRFLKLYGYRIGLDEAELLIKNELGVLCACTGSDKKMSIYVTEKGIERDVVRFVSAKTGIIPGAFEVVFVEQIPKNDAGKTLYEKLGK